MVSYHLILTYWQKVPVNKRKFHFKTRMKCLNIGMNVSCFTIYVANFVSMYFFRILIFKNNFIFMLFLFRDFLKIFLTHLLSSCPFWDIFLVCSTGIGSYGVGRLDSFYFLGRSTSGSFSRTSWKMICNLWERFYICNTIYNINTWIIIELC